MITIAYIAYLLISVGMTVWVAATLSRNGRVFLVSGFNGDESLADSVNHMLVVGFYLLNLGYVLLAMQTAGDIDDLRAIMEMLGRKVGLVMLVLGAMHFFNMYVIARWRSAGWRGVSAPKAG
jgi:hypothetical protein